MTADMPRSTDAALEGCAITAHLLAADQAGRWLLLRTARDHSRWQFPGGRVLPGERPREAAQREAAEETGLDLPATDFLIASWVSGEQRDRIAFLFATRTLLNPDLQAIKIDGKEVDSWCLVAPEPANLPVHPLLAERLSVINTVGPGQYIEQRPQKREKRLAPPE
ncbi:NUDIX domain-containing protein [Nonomuraea sp. B19D2]|uniref:NUDIX domain-containing protein n=1 Tax=Nonomuraea sp. B19D2 TaxID=3159561 RepID=UPI0032DA9A5D